MEQNQQFDPFKFLTCAELAGAEIGPAGQPPGARWRPAPRPPARSPAAARQPA